MTHRPQSWDGYVGQEKLKKRLQIHAKAAEVDDKRMPHVLLIGPPGCGKTTLAELIAKDSDRPFESFIMPIPDRLLQALVEEFHGVVLLDEIHRSKPKEQERLLPLIEDGYLQHATGERVYNDFLTIVAATTEGDKVIKPLYDRFPVRPIFEDYTDDEIVQIIHRFAESAGITIDDNTVVDLAPAALGVPRNAKAFIEMHLDLSIELGRDPSAEEILDIMRITPEGLTAEHVRYCKYLATAGGSAGLDLMKTLLGLPVRAVENLEIDLIKQGCLKREKSGRLLTRRGYAASGTRGSYNFGERNRDDDNRGKQMFDSVKGNS